MRLAVQQAKIKPARIEQPGARAVIERCERSSAEHAGGGLGRLTLLAPSPVPVVAGQPAERGHGAHELEETKIELVGGIGMRAGQLRPVARQRIDGRAEKQRARRRSLPLAGPCQPLRIPLTRGGADRQSLLKSQSLRAGQRRRSPPDL